MHSTHHPNKKNNVVFTAIIIIALLIVGVIVMNSFSTPAPETPAKAGTGTAVSSTGGTDAGPVPTQEVL